MAVSISERFQSAPAVLRAAITNYISAKYPQAASAISWDAQGTRATGSKMGVSFSLDLMGTGPTDVIISASLSFLASLAVSEATVEARILEALHDLRRFVP